MPSIFPDVDSAAGVPVRNPDGTPANPPEVHNAYAPAPEFISTCEITALPSNCDARIEPRQINAIVSELISFAECLDPDGPWDCSSLQNLCNAFSAWMAAQQPIIFVGDFPPTTPPPVNGTLWWESDTGVLMVYYSDGTSSQWVAATPVPVHNMDGISIVGTGTVGDPHSVGLVDCGAY